MKTIDIFELCRLRRTVSGDFSLKDMPELALALEGEAKSAQVHFSATGNAGNKQKALPGADLTIEATMVTQCVRCMKPITVTVSKTLPFLFTKTEAQADSIPVDEDDDAEIVVGSDRFSLVDWVQEELILSLPQFPHHENCECMTEQTHNENPVKVTTRPFADLRALMKS